MAIYTKTRSAQSTETPDTGQGGTAFDSISASSGSTSMSIDDNGSQTDTARWFNFDSSDLFLPGILSKRLKFDWSVGGTLDVSVDADGTADASYSFSITGASSSNSIGLTGPGPVSNHLDINDSGSVDTDVTSTPIGSIEVDTSLNGAASSSVTGDSNSSPSCSITNIRLEITLKDGTVVVLT